MNRPVHFIGIKIRCTEKDTPYFLKEEPFYKQDVFVTNLFRTTALDRLFLNEMEIEKTVKSPIRFLLCAKIPTVYTAYFICDLLENCYLICLKAFPNISVISPAIILSSE